MQPRVGNIDSIYRYTVYFSFHLSIKAAQKRYFSFPGQEICLFGAAELFAATLCFLYQVSGWDLGPNEALQGWLEKSRETFRSVTSCTNRSALI